MKAARFLEKKRVIQFFGLALSLAPFANLFLFIYMDKLNKNPYMRPLTILEHLKTGSTLHYFLAFISFAIGIVMLVSGSTKVWKLVLGFLAVHIYIQFQSLAVNLKQHWIWGAFFLINAAAFVFIAEQLVFKVEPVKKKKLPRTPIGFKGYGAWAELVEVSYQGIRVRKTSPPPKDIESRIVSFKFRNQSEKSVALNAKYSRAEGTEYYFLFYSISELEKKELANWINRNAS